MPLPMSIYLGSPHYCLSLRRNEIDAGAQIPQRRSRVLLLQSVRTPAVVRIAASRCAIDGVSEALNSVASQSLDTAAVRRRVRAAFLEVQERLDHFLFKEAPSGILMEEVHRVQHTCR